MAAYLYFFDPARQVINDALPFATNGKANGIWFDGFYYWVCHNTGECTQLHLTQSGTLVEVSSFSIASTAPDYSDTPSGICGDDTYLYIGYQYSDSGGFQGFVIGQWTRDGTYITALEGTRTLAVDTTAEFRKDITTNGKNICYTAVEDAGAFVGTRTHTIAESENTVLLASSTLTINSENPDGIAYAGGHQLFIGYGIKGKFAKMNDALDLAIQPDFGELAEELVAIDFGSSIKYSKIHAKTYQTVMSNFDDGRLIVAVVNK